VELLRRTAAKGRCSKRQVGCLIVIEGEVVIAAANGTPPGTTACDEGGCVRCTSASQFEHGREYDLCSCLHAEEAAIAAAAADGVALTGSHLFSSYQPCIMCAKLIIACGIQDVSYVEEWEVPTHSVLGAQLKVEYEGMWRALPGSCAPIQAGTATLAERCG
jgi:dCMP deaminase